MQNDNKETQNNNKETQNNLKKRWKTTMTTKRHTTTKMQIKCKETKYKGAQIT